MYQASVSRPTGHDSLPGVCCKVRTHLENDFSDGFGWPSRQSRSVWLCQTWACKKQGFGFQAQDCIRSATTGCLLKHLWNLWRSLDSYVVTAQAHGRKPPSSRPRGSEGQGSPHTSSFFTGRPAVNSHESWFWTGRIQQAGSFISSPSQDEGSKHKLSPQAGRLTELFAVALQGSHLQLGASVTSSRVVAIKKTETRGDGACFNGRCRTRATPSL